jgi:predicted dinucleotide-binding enzyme
MKVAVVGRGNVGGRLADLWERAGHEVTRIGREGGDVSDAEAVLVAVPGGAIAEALDNVQGIEEKTVIDATNLVGVDPRQGSHQTPNSLSPGRTVQRRSRSTSTSQRSTIGFAKLAQHRAICGPATRRHGRLSSS